VARGRQLLHRIAQQLPLYPHLEPVKRLAQRRWLRDIVGINLQYSTNGTHQRDAVDDLMVCVVVFEQGAVNEDVLLAGEPVAGEFAHVLSRLFG